MKNSRWALFLPVAILMLSWTAVVGASEIVIGYTGPLSGPAAEYGWDCLNGVDMAINELNAGGGITVDGQKHFFKLERLDDKVDQTLAINNARRFRTNNALAVFNPVFSTTSAIMKINQEAGNEFILMGYTSSAKATEMGNKLLVVGAPLLTIYAQLYADMAWERGWRKAAMVVTLGAYGEEWRQTFKGYWEKLGGTMTADKPANYYTKTDFSAPLKAALATKPDVVLIGGPSATTALVIEQARALGFKGGLLLVDQAKMDYIAQILEGTKLMENVIGTAGLGSVPLPAGASFERKYRETYKRMNTWEVTLHYCAMYALARAISSAGTVDNIYSIRAAFPKAFPLLGNRFPNEMFGITPAGRMYVPGSIQTVKSGKFMTPSMYVWWANSRQEFNDVKRLTKITLPMKRVQARIGKVE